MIFADYLNDVSQSMIFNISRLNLNLTLCLFWVRHVVPVQVQPEALQLWRRGRGLRHRRRGQQGGRGGLQAGDGRRAPGRAGGRQTRSRSGGSTGTCRF